MNGPKNQWMIRKPLQGWYVYETWPRVSPAAIAYLTPIGVLKKWKWFRDYSLPFKLKYKNKVRNMSYKVNGKWWFMTYKTLNVLAQWDLEVSVWVAEGSDIPGLITEANSSLEELEQKLKVMIPELRPENEFTEALTSTKILVHKRRK